MKKRFVIMILSFLIVTLLFGCDFSNSIAETTNNPQDHFTENENHQSPYAVYISDFSDSGSSAEFELEYVFADQDKYNEDNIDKHKEILIDKFNFNGEYFSTKYYAYNYYPVYEYQSENAIFAVTPDGKLANFFAEKSNKEADIISKEECINIAKDFVSKIIDITDYKISVTENETKKEYFIVFTKYLGNYKTSDSIHINILYTGEIYCYSSFMLGEIDCNTDASGIDIESVSKSVTEKLDKIFEPAREEFDRIEYGEYNYTFTQLKEGYLGIICDVNVDCIDDFGEYSEVISERIELVVAIE